MTGPTIVRRVAFTLLALLASSAPMGAQAAPHGDTVTVALVLPHEVALEAVTLYNSATAIRASDRLEIAAGQEVRGNVAVLNGPLEIAGHVAGRVVALNADVILRKGARIDGGLLVIGGEVEGREDATIGGDVRVYRPTLRYSQEGDQLVALDNDTNEGEQWWRRLDRLRRRNSNRLEIATAGPYNRVEGLPVRLGPVLYRDQGWGHLRLDAFAILRTASSFSSSRADVGHDMRAELRVGRQYGATLGGRLFDVIDGVEQWQLSNAEVGLASFLFRRDYRDYYGRHGGELYATVRATDNADLVLSYGDERWRSRDAANPVALSREDHPWRANPAVDAGRFHVLHTTLRIDTRNDEFNPWAGWYLLADFERGTGTIDGAAPTSPGVQGLPLASTRYQRGFFDMRRYNRLAPNAALNVRIVLGGWLSGDPLPLERRLSIDGPGTVPGFDFRTHGDLDVGARSTDVAPAGRPAQCERVALGQLEYRTDVHISLSDERNRGSARRTRFRADGQWVFFADAGRGWLVNSPGSVLNYRRSGLPPLSTYRTDIGLGLDFDRIGIYTAKALSDPTEPLNVFFRVRHRF